MRSIESAEFRDHGNKMEVEYVLFRRGPELSIPADTGGTRTSLALPNLVSARRSAPRTSGMARCVVHRPTAAPRDRPDRWFAGNPCMSRSHRLNLQPRWLAETSELSILNTTFPPR